MHYVMKKLKRIQGTWNMYIKVKDLWLLRSIPVCYCCKLKYYQEMSVKVLLCADDSCTASPHLSLSVDYFSSTDPSFFEQSYSLHQNICLIVVLVCVVGWFIIFIL